MNTTNMKPRFLIFGALALIASAAVLWAAENQANTWTDPAVAATEDPSFVVQGEYGIAKKGQSWALQVVALGDGKLDAYLLEGGFPGLGYTRNKQRIKLSGQLGDTAGTAKLENDAGYSATIANESATVVKGDAVLGKLPKVERQSDTIGKKPEAGAIVLFDGTDESAKANWDKGEAVDGLLRNNDIATKKKFSSYHLHLEFRTPYKPFARGQGRGNSGVYHQGRYETQVLDAFGLTGEDNETGGIYKVAKPKVNMCLPPLTWQTYDVDFEAAKFDADGKKQIEPAYLTVWLNGFKVHDRQPVKSNTGGGKPVTAEPGPVFLQGHGNPVFYRNIWIAEK
jgi:hypothetical protein